MAALFLGFVLSLLVSLIIIRWSEGHAQLAFLRGRDQPQTAHSHPAPRLGGVALVVSLACVSAYNHFWGGRPTQGMVAVLLLCAVPAFVVGTFHDLRDSVDPKGRLLATAVSAALAFHFMGAAIKETDIPVLDSLVASAAGSFLLTIFTVAGISNAMNLIDGLNGLAAMCALMMLIALAYVGYQVGDWPVTYVAMAGIGAVMGFFVWNYPNGLIFLGDGGAYFLGFYVAETALLLLVRNPGEVSPLFPLLVCIYPAFETLFSIYRRWMRGSLTAVDPDRAHLHSLLFRRLMRWAVGARTARQLTRSNSMTSPILWLLCLLTVVPAMAFWDDSSILGGFIALFAVTYVGLYWRIVRFRTPKWLRARRARARTHDR